MCILIKSTTSYLSKNVHLIFVLHYCLQKAHVQQFLATEDAINKSAEARDMYQKLIKRLHGSGGVISSNSLSVGGPSQNTGSLRQFEVISQHNLCLLTMLS